MDRMQEIAPAARVDGLVVTESRDELLIYDTGPHHIHHLNPLSAVVWRLCDGRRTMTNLVREAGRRADGMVTAESVRLALVKLDEANLLVGRLGTDFRGTGQSRRDFVRRSAIGGAVAVPMIVSMSAPHAAAASSACLGPGQCNASTVGHRCAPNPANCQSSALACWEVPTGPPGNYFCGARPD